ncbi:sodium/potassium-transporting ATPase subunit beta-1-interacting protein 1-like [Tubulanus polymorphus]|uniref:sodium/potassium-transporting ATPase subunit beta-1-interacting protein 1-like n=1 Tax=Tubulanus polymorphus TaxID=672921 RepID=UPI003DA5D4B6
MGCCTGRCILITLCSLQLILSVEHQVFCFLGYLWGAIIGNFLQIIMVIIGLFGACQYRPRVVLAYAIWLLLWLAVGIFVICLYLKIGLLTDLDGIQVLSIGTRSESWWLQYGIGCGTRQGCLLAWQYVEIIHTGLQCLLCIIAFIAACYVIYVFMEEDDSSQPVSDELEYIKMRYKSPSRALNYRDAGAGATLRELDSMPASNESDYNSFTLHTTIDATTLDRRSVATHGSHRQLQQQPTLLQQLHGNNTQQRHSIHVDKYARSNSDKYSQKSGSGGGGSKPDVQQQTQQRLPWVTVAPSVTSDLPQVIDDDPGPPSYYQIQMTDDRRYRDYRRDKDSIII